MSAQSADIARRALSEANLWLDTACTFDPTSGETQMLTRAGWVEDTLESWAKFAGPVAQSMNDALASVISERLGNSFNGEIAGMLPDRCRFPSPMA